MPPWLDVSLAVALVAYAVVDTLANDSAPNPAIRAAFAALTVASVALRTVHPSLAAGLFSIGMTAESVTTEAPDEMAVLLAILLVSYGVGAHLARRESMLSGGLICLALTITIATDPSDSVSNIPISVLLFAVLPWLLGTVVRHRRQDVADLTERATAAERDAQDAVDAERRRLARELHDVVSHAVTLIAVQAEAGQSVIDIDPAAAARALGSIGQVSREALDELARLLAVLDEQASPSESDLSALPALVAGVRATGLRVDLDDRRSERSLDPAVDRCAYRVVQEALTNALRHTAGGHVDVRVSTTAGTLDVEVRSQGRPHTSSYGGSGRGLVGLSDRVVALGGTIEAGPRDGAFVVRAALPARA